MSERQEDLRKLGGGGALLLVSTVVGNGLLLLLDIYQNGLLAPADYGAWSILRRIAALAGFAGLLGLENIVIREVSVGRGEGVLRSAAAQAGLVSTMLAGALLAAGSLASAPGSSSVELGALELGLVAATLPLASVRLLAVSARQGRGDLRSRALVMFLAWPLVQFCLLPPLLTQLSAPRAVAVAYAGSMTLGAALALGMAWRGDPGVLEPRTHGVRLLRESWPLWLQGLAMAGYTWLDQLLLAALAGAGAAAVYGPVAALAPVYGLGLTALNGRFSTMIAAKFLVSDHAGLQSLYQTVTRLAVLLGAIPLAVTLGAAPTVLSLWPGAEPTAALPLRITALAWMGCTLVGSVNYLLIMAGHQRHTLVNAAAGVATSVLLSLILVPSLGVTGAALANAAAILAANGLGAWQVWRLLRLTPFHQGLLPPLLAAIPATGAAYAIAAGLSAPPLLQLAAVGVGAAAMYMAAMAPLLHPDDRFTLASLFRRRGPR